MNRNLLSSRKKRFVCWARRALFFATTRQILAALMDVRHVESIGLADPTPRQILSKAKDWHTADLS
jgi:hypothetical protein